MALESPARPLRVVGRYAIYDAIASGGMATVHLGRLIGPQGFSRTVAIKRLHDAYVADSEFVAMFIDEARLAARVRHPNVLQTLDLVCEENDLLLVVDYVQGQTLAQLLQFALSQRGRVPHRIVASILSGVLQGLHAAHEARDEHGKMLGLVHRDVSPQNVMVGLDGVARVLDFGVAKAEGRLQMTRDGQVKGKLGYIAPEQIEGAGVSRRTDVYAASVVLWEALTGRPLIAPDTPAAMVARMLQSQITPPSRIVMGLPTAYDDVVLRGLARDPDKRYPTAREMALALEACDGVESNAAVGAWLERLIGAVREAEPNKTGMGDAISRVHAVDRKSAVDDAIEWDWSLLDDPLEEMGDDEGTTLSGDALTTELRAPSLLDDRERAELLSASDWELTRPEGAQSQSSNAPPARPPAPMRAAPVRPAPVAATPAAAPAAAVIAEEPEPPRRRSRFLRVSAFLLLSSAALAGAAYHFREKLPWLPKLDGIELPPFLSSLVGQREPEALPAPAATTEPSPTTSAAQPEPAPSASASASASAAPSVSASAAPSATAAPRATATTTTRRAPAPRSTKPAQRTATTKKKTAIKPR